MDLSKKIKRGFHLRKRGFFWLMTASLGEFSIFSKLASLVLLAHTKINIHKLLWICGIHSNQLWKERQNALINLINKFNAPIKVLEIGSWMSQGSTLIFLKNLPKNSQLILLDSWTPFVKDAEEVGSSKRMDSFHEVALISTLRTLDKYQDIETIIMRAKSCFATSLKSNTFDLIYIDGSHYYEVVTQDILNSLDLIKDGGIICGDDLDYLPTEDNYCIAKAHLKDDLFIFEDGSAMHPGVLAAVYENLPTNNIKMVNGFWSLTINK